MTEAAPKPKIRLDQLVVQHDLAPSQEKAQALILAGQIRVVGYATLKAGNRFHPDTPLERVGEPMPYVSRGGEKLKGALDHFAFSPQGLRVLDIGASTGGFTDCLLAHGACHADAVDVGYGQLAWSLRQDARVSVWERTNIRHLPSTALAEKVDLAVIDVSFISLEKVLADALRFLKPAGHVLALIKPQFEAGRLEINRGGIVRDAAVHQAVQDRIQEKAQSLALSLLGTAPSILRGKKKGNQEFFALWQWQAPLAEG